MLPAKLKEDIINQIDQSLSVVRASGRVSLTASHSIVDEHIAITELISLVNVLEAVHCEVFPAKAVMEKSEVSSFHSIIAVTDYGETYLVETDGQTEGGLTLKSYFRIDEVMETFEGSWSELRKELVLGDEVLVIQYTANTREPLKANSTAPSLNHPTDYSPRYVINHFLNHKRYAWGIIGISVVLALLGVAMPLGFQTFTDKILPYSAMN